MSERPERSRISTEALESLGDRGLLPPHWEGDVASVGLVVGDHDYVDRYVGTLLAGACGDALGRPGEGRPPSKIRERHGRLTDFIPWRGYRSGPVKCRLRTDYRSRRDVARQTPERQSMRRSCSLAGSVGRMADRSSTFEKGIAPRRLISALPGPSPSPLHTATVP